MVGSVPDLRRSILPTAREIGPLGRGRLDVSPLYDPMRTRTIENGLDGGDPKIP